MKKILVVFGTRPEAIKLAPVVRQLQRSRTLQPVVCVTAQHRQILDQMMEVFHLRADFDLNIMSERQSLAEVTQRVLEGVTRVLAEIQPACVVVQGDTTTAFAAALAAFYNGIEVVHVEAGLRTHDKRQPFPEEINRCLITRIADFHFAPTAANRQNLLREGISARRILITGNTGVDALQWMLQSSKGSPANLDGLQGIDWRRDFPILVTVHRRENWSDMERICDAMKRLLCLDPRVHVILPVHPNPALGEILNAQLKGAPRIHLVPALPYAAFVQLMKHCHVVVTDSGGVQEEVAGLGKPLVVMRQTTERPEVIASGYGVLAGTAPAKIVSAVKAALAHGRGRRRRNPFGDGRAAERIVACLETRLNSGTLP